MERRIGHVAAACWLSLICVLGLTACGQSTSSTATAARAPGDDAVLTFQASDETLRLPLLQSGTEVYEDVVLSLRQDGGWALKSVGQRRALAAGQLTDAVLETDTAQVLAAGWQPQSASIRIKRLHLDDKVFANVTLRLAATVWRWESGMQEVRAFSVTDFSANTRLAATDADHVALRSHPDARTQQFPLRLQNKYYNFCFDRHEGPGDTFALTDSSGAQVFRVKAGDPCVSFLAQAGVYTFTHTYGNEGKVATLFLRAVTSGASGTAARREPMRPQAFSLADQANFPEYWGIFAVGNAQTPAGGYLSMNSYGDGSTYKGPCYAFIDAAGQLGGYSRPGGPANLPLWDTAGSNFFKMTRDANGNPSAIGTPLLCSTWATANVSAEYRDDFNTFYHQSVYSPTGYRYGVATGVGQYLTLAPSGFQNGLFTIAYNSTYVSLQGYGRSGFVGFPDGFSGPAGTQVLANGMYPTFPQLKVIAATATPQQFRLDYRYFPQGLPPSQRNSDGTWMLADQEVALFDGANCTGKAMILAGDGRTTPPGGLGLFGRSMQLGARASAVLHKTWNSNATDAANMAILNQSGCINSLAAPGGAWTAAQVTVSANATQMLVSHNACANCNLTGLQMTSVDSLRGVSLPYANLTGASFSNSDLTGADLRNATLQGAKLNNTNFEGANFCGATLNSTAAAGATSLAGAHLKNVNFYNANLDGAILTYASFYSSNPGICTSPPAGCSAPSTPVCANGNASWNKADLTNAYLSGADFGGARAASANFSGAVLFGARFNNATLSRADGSLSGANFSNAFLQGTDFTGARLDYAQFNNAYFDQDTSNSCMQIALNNEYTGFRGFKTPDPSDSSGNTCISAPQPAPTCLQVSYTANTGRPALNATSSCPDGTPGPCNNWQSRVTSTIASSTCNATAPLCGSDPFLAPPPNKCW